MRIRRPEPALVTLLFLSLSGCGDEGARPGVEAPAAPPGMPAAPGTIPPTTPSGVPELQGRLPAGISEQTVQDGQRLFSGRAGCFTCHGREAEGGALGPRLNDRRWIHLETGELGEIREIIRTGVPMPSEYPGPMPPMGGLPLSEQELDALAAYVYAISRGV